MNTEFLLTSLVVILIPGTGIVYAVSNGLSSVTGQVSWLHLFVPWESPPFYLTATILGLSAILHMSTPVFQMIKYTGVAYLFCMTWMMWKDKGAIVVDLPKGDNSSFWKIAFCGFLINILNPKLSICFLAFFTTSCC